MVLHRADKHLLPIEPWNVMPYIDPPKPLGDEVRGAGHAVTGVAQLHAIIGGPRDVREQGVGTNAECRLFIEFNGFIRSLLPQDDTGMCTPGASLPPNVCAAFDEVTSSRVRERLAVVRPTLSRCGVRVCVRADGTRLHHRSPSIGRVLPRHGSQQPPLIGPLLVGIEHLANDQFIQHQLAVELEGLVGPSRHPS